MKLIRHSTSCLVHLLLLAELLVPSSSHPTGSRSLCGNLKSMGPHVESLITSSKKLHGLQDGELGVIILMENRLSSLPEIHHHTGYFKTVQVNESLSELLAYSQSFRLHVDWLETAQENMSLPSHSAQDASAHLGHLSKHLDTTLQQVNRELPQPPSPSSPPSPSPPSLPVPSTTFDVLRYSVEISKRLRAFSHWTKRVLLHLKKVSLRCPQH